MQKSNTNKKKAKGKKKPDKSGAAQDERAAPERQTEALHQQVCPRSPPPLPLPVHRIAAPPCWPYADASLWHLY